MPSACAAEAALCIMAISCLTLIWPLPVVSAALMVSNVFCSHSSTLPSLLRSGLSEAIGTMMSKLGLTPAVVTATSCIGILRRGRGNKKMKRGPLSLARCDAEVARPYGQNYEAQKPPRGPLPRG